MGSNSGTLSAVPNGVMWDKAVAPERKDERQLLLQVGIDRCLAGIADATKMG